MNSIQTLNLEEDEKSTPIAPKKEGPPPKKNPKLLSFNDDEV
jgi:hypothetical protein